jgi:hypothetical protein
VSEPFFLPSSMSFSTSGLSLSLSITIRGASVKSELYIRNRPRIPLKNRRNRVGTPKKREGADPAPSLELISF